MNTSKRCLIAVLVLLLTACGAAPATPADAPADIAASNPEAQPTATAIPADLVLYNGTVLVLDESGQAASAIALRGDKIVATGSDEEMLAYANAGTRTIDLEGRTVMPAFVDAHAHLFGRAGDNGMTLESVQDFAFQNGITTTAELAVDPALLATLQGMVADGELRLRTSVYLMYNNACGDILGDWYKDYPPLREPDQLLRIGGVKIYSDGGFCNAPAVSFEFPVGGHGDLYFDQNSLNALVADLQQSGYQVAIHSLGDRSLDVVLNAFDYALDGKPNTLRHRIEHNAVVRPDQLGRYSDHQLVATIFAPFATCAHLGDMSRFKYSVPDANRDWEWRWRDLMDANPGVTFAWHSDWPVFNLLNGFEHLWAFVTRAQVAEDGSICMPPDWIAANAISVKEALQAMTSGAAYALGWENEVGSLEPGKTAELLIVSDNPLTVDPYAIRGIQILATMTRGDFVYCAEGEEGYCEAQ